MNAARRKGEVGRGGNKSGRNAVSGRNMDRRTMIERLEWLCAMALTVLIVVLHVERARRAGALWRDEVSTLGAATMPSLSQLWSSLVYESFPLLFYGVVRIWTEIHWLGSTDISLRMLGALVGAGVLLVLWLNKRLLGNHAPILSLLLFGLNPAMIQWGDSLRGYGLGSILILLAYGLIWKVIESPTPKRVAFATLVSILSVQSLYQNAFLLLAFCSGGFLVCLRKRMWKRMLVVFGIGTSAAASLAPYWPIIQTARAVHNVADVTVGFSQILIAFGAVLGADNGFLLWTWMICCGVSILSALYLIALYPKRQDYEKRSDLAIYGLTILGVGTLGFLFFLREIHFAPQPWFYIVLIGSIAVSIDVLLDVVATAMSARVIRLAMVLSVACVAIPVAWRGIQLRQTNVDIVASTLQDRASPEDLIVINPWFVGITFQHYYRGATRWITVPQIQELRLTRYDLLKEQSEMEDPLQPVLQAIEKSLTSGNRLWWVGGIDFPPQGRPPGPLPRMSDKKDGLFVDEYQHALSTQLGHFIQSHVLGAQRADPQIAQPVSPYEHLPVVVYGGWRP